MQALSFQNNLHLPDDAESIPEEAAQKFVCSAYPTVSSVLEATRHLIAQDIASHPELRQFIRNVYKEDAVVSIYPTERGMTEINPQHPYYVRSFRAH